MSEMIPDPSRFAPPAEVGSMRNRALIVGVVGAVASVVGLMGDSHQFYRSYLVAWLFWVSVAVGCFALSMLHHTTGGAWGLVVRRIFEAASRTLPALLVLFVPLAIGVGELYVWADPEKVKGDHLLEHKAAYLNVNFWITRTVVFFVVWIAIAALLDRMARRQDREGGADLKRRLQHVGALGVLVYVLTITFAAVDWLMSLDPHWYSSMYGVYFLGGQGLAAFAFTIVIALWLSKREPMRDVLQPRHFHDLGKLMFAFVMLWAYFSFSQFLIIWSGNLPEEVIWYLHRFHGGFKAIALAIVVFHFALPFLLLLSADLKRKATLLASVAALILVMRWVDLYWQAVPGFHGDVHIAHWLDFATLIGVGGLWLGLFFHQLAKRPLLPLGDPALPEAIAHESH